MRQTPPCHDHERDTQDDPGDVHGAAYVVPVQRIHDVVPHGADGDCELPTMPVLLLDGQRKPGIAEPVAHPCQVGGCADDRCHQCTAARRPTGGALHPSTSDPDLDGDRNHQQKTDRSHGPCAQAGQRRPPPAAGPGTQEGHHGAEQQGRVRIGQDHGVGRGGQGHQPHRAPSQSGIAEVPSHQDPQTCHRHERAGVGHDHQRHAGADSRYLADQASKEWK